jgi:hypothetical protein
VITQFAKLLARLTDERVEFIIVGGFAAAMHGALRPTLDLDVVYQRTPENMIRLIRALERETPYPRGAPPGLPFRWDAHTLRLGSNFTLNTSLGQIDLLGEITGGGGYDKLLPFARKSIVFDRECLCLELAKLIEVKRAAGRAKDYEAIAELEAIRDERGRGSVG